MARVVIDTSVMRTAGEEDASGCEECRKCLDALLHLRHCYVLTDSLADEYITHSGRFGLVWQVKMADNGLEVHVKHSTNADIRKRIQRAQLSPARKKALLKDVRLIEAALQADKIIVSRDEEARNLYAKMAAECKEIGEIMWINPDRPEDEAASVLQCIEPYDEKRTLKHHVSHPIQRDRTRKVRKKPCSRPRRRGNAL